MKTYIVVSTKYDFQRCRVRHVRYISGFVRNAFHIVYCVLFCIKALLCVSIYNMKQRDSPITISTNCMVIPCAESLVAVHLYALAFFHIGDQ